MKKKTKKKVRLALLIAAILLALAVIGLLKASTTNSKPVRLYIPEGCTPAALADTLAPLLPAINHHLLSINTFQPGSYLVEPRTNIFLLARRIRNGQQTPVRLTIGKFRTPEQLNAYLNKKLMHNDFDIPLDSFHLIRPDTYELYWTVTPEAFLQRMRKEYRQYGLTPYPSPKGEGGKTQTLEQQADKFAQQNHLLPSPKGEGAGVRLVLILASIVEEETNNAAEKPLIASVYINRLRIGMPLQADPTVKYAVGDFTIKRIVGRHLAVESPFNTYRHPGLPPAPICLPSAASVDAVLNAPKTSYLYFCASDKMDGTHRFAATLDEHRRNAAAFHRALNRRGIK